MKLGYFTLTDNPPGYGDERQDPNELIRNTLEQCVYAEELGFHSVWVPEHHFGMFGVLPSPSAFLCHVAARTERVKLAPGTVVLPLNHPVRVAEEFALLDVLSNGRAVLSAGRGYDAREYEAFGADFTTSQEHFFEGMDIIKKAWTQESFSHEGKHYQVPEVSITPRPVQQPFPPTYVACFSQPTLMYAARNGFDCIFAPFAATMMYGSVQAAVAEFKNEAAKAGYPNSQAMCSYFCNVTYDEVETLRTKERLLKYFHGIMPALPQIREETPPHIQYFVDITTKLKSMSPSDLGERSIITGDPENCRRILKDCEEAGIQEVILYFNFGGLGHRDTIEAMERAARELLPHFLSPN